LDDIKEWCEKDIGYLKRAPNDRNKWKEMVKCALDTYSLPMENDDNDITLNDKTAKK